MLILLGFHEGVRHRESPVKAAGAISTIFFGDLIVRGLVDVNLDMQGDLLV